MVGAGICVGAPNIGTMDWIYLALPWIPLSLLQIECKPKPWRPRFAITNEAQWWHRTVGCSMPIWGTTLPAGICVGTGALLFELGVSCGIYLYIVVGVLVILLLLLLRTHSLTYLLTYLPTYLPTSSSSGSGEVIVVIPDWVHTYSALK